MADDDTEQRGGHGRLRRPWLVAAIPVMALVAVASVQFVTAQTTDLSQWKGGGFGMFTTVDTGVNRVVHIYFEVDGEEHPVWEPPAFGEEFRSLSPMPTEERMERTAVRLLHSEWVQIEGTVPPGAEPLVHQADRATDRHWIPRQSTHDDEDVMHPDAVRLELWKLQFEGDAGGGGEMHRHKIRQVEVRGEES